MIQEKIFKCNTYYHGYKEIEEIIKELNIELAKGYHITKIEQHPLFSIDAISKEPDLIIYLERFN